MFTYLGNGKIYYSGDSLSGMQFRKNMNPFIRADAIGRSVNPNGDNPTTTLNIPLIRYAEVLLMKSEAQIWSGQNGDDALNQVRGRAGLAAIINSTKQHLITERRCALAGAFSNLILYLIRWGLAKE